MITKPAPPTTNDRKDFLDVARGVAALLVVVDHGLACCLPAYQEWSRSNVVFGYAMGQFGVLVFFMVSGFVVPLSLEKGGSLVGFWQRRIFRLFPVYWLSLAFAVAFVAAGGNIGRPLADTGTWVANSFMIQSFVHRPHVWGVYWTLPWELIIYVACSVLFLSRILDRIGTRACFGVLFVLASAGVVQPFLEGKPRSLDGMRQMVLFCCLFGLLTSRHVAGRASKRAVGRFLLALGAAVVLVWAVNRALFPAAVPLRALGRTALLWGTAYAFFFALLNLRHQRMPGLLCWLGRRSYPIYLLHPFVLAILPSWSPWAYFPALFGLTLLLAALAHRFVEQPGIALGRKLEARSKPAVVAVKSPATPPTRQAA